MSEETYRAVEEALKAHMADESNGGLLNHWVLIAHAISATSSSRSHYQFMNHDGPPHEWHGLLDLGMQRKTKYSDDEED